VRKHPSVCIMEFFNFEPDEYRVLEEIEFDETVQRPEKVRFYTLEDQLVDATEKMIPRDRRYTRYDLEKIKQEVTRLEELYNKYVVPTEDTYELREPEYAKRLDWVVRAVDDPEPVGTSIDQIQLVYASTFRDTRAAGFYPRLLDALPRFRFGKPPGVPHVPERIETVRVTNARDSLEIRALPRFEITRTERHSDQTATVTSVPVGGTEDTVYTSGYRITDRGVPIPNPSPDHPFFKESENDLDIVLDSTAPLADIVPSLSAIFEHGVPVTQDPYGEGRRFLKVYDVKMENIPWTLWKSRFPPVAPVTKTPQVDELQFPKPPQNAPGEKILNAYKTPYAPGVSARKWLMEQVDGGDLVPRALLADAFTNGSVPLLPGLDLGPIRYPDTTLDQCELTGKIFEEFQTAGLLRRTITQDKTDKERSIVTYTCVPPEFILQERRRLGYVGRLPFKESAPTQILKDHVETMAKHRMSEKEEAEEVEAKTPARADSIRRTEILSILADERRTPQDKVKDTRELLKETTLEKQIHSDTDGAFVLCEHTLAVLTGELANDRRKFYIDWTASEDGFRVCKFCGERILRDDAVDQEEFDDAGRLIVKAEAMDKPVFKSETLAGYITGIQALRGLFKEDSPVHDIIYTVLTILHVLPEADKTQQILSIANILEKTMFKATEAGTEAVRINKGFVGLALAIVMLQSHIPALIPRRSFGSRPLKLDGYPRDSPKSDEYNIVDSILLVIRSTYDAFPGAVKGPSSAAIRAILRESKKMKTIITKILDRIISQQDALKDMLQKARVHYAERPVIQSPPASLLPPVPPPEKLDVIQRFGECRSSLAILENRRPPKIEQEAPPLKRGIVASEGAKLVEPSRSRRTKVVAMPTPEIVARRKVGPGAIDYALKDGWRTNLLLANRLADLFLLDIPVRTVDPTQTPDELRDIAKGHVYAALREIQSTPVKRKQFAELRQTDLILLMLSAQIDLEVAAVNKVLARQRKTFVQRMAEKTDFEREIIEELKRRGMAPIIITTGDRELFAAEIENELRPVRAFSAEEAEVAEAGDDGVGLPQAPEGPEEDTTGLVLDRGDYGDAAPLPVGRDPPVTSLADDAETSV
jgi:hypothetical protein